MRIKLKQLLEKSWLTNKFQAVLLSVVLVPITSTEQFLDLDYSKGTSNKVTLGKVMRIEVEKSASPLFYRLKDVKKLKEIKLKGRVNIIRPIDKSKDDSYFQLGVIYKGDYRPNAFVKVFLPSWLKKVLSMHEEYGVGNIDFHEISAYGKKLDRREKVRGITMNFKTAKNLNQDRTFDLVIAPRDQEVLGFWFRADGDDSEANFQLELSSMEIN